MHKQEIRSIVNTHGFGKLYSNNLTILMHTIIVRYCDVCLCSTAPIDGVQWVIHSESDTECLLIFHSVVISDGDFETHLSSISSTSGEGQ